MYGFAKLLVCELRSGMSFIVAPFTDFGKIITENEQTFIDGMLEVAKRLKALDAVSESSTLD